MSSINYTIRNIPEPVDQYLRKLAQKSGKSMNQIIIEELSEKTSIPDNTLLDSLAWFIGSGMDTETLKALDDY